MISALGISSVVFKFGLFVIALITLVGGGWFFHDSVYTRGVRVGQAQSQSASLKTAIADLQAQIKDNQEIIAAYEDRRDQDAAEIATLREQANVTPPNDTVCLDADAADRINRVR